MSPGGEYCRRSEVSEMIWSWQDLGGIPREWKTEVGSVRRRGEGRHMMQGEWHEQRCRVGDDQGRCRGQFGLRKDFCVKGRGRKAWKGRGGLGCERL